jgi:hypothetical protein
MTVITHDLVLNVIDEIVRGGLYIVNQPPNCPTLGCGEYIYYILSLLVFTLS